MYNMDMVLHHTTIETELQIKLTEKEGFIFAVLDSDLNRIGSGFVDSDYWTIGSEILDSDFSDPEPIRSIDKPSLDEQSSYLGFELPGFSVLCFAYKAKWNLRENFFFIHVD